MKPIRLMSMTHRSSRNRAEAAPGPFDELERAAEAIDPEPLAGLPHRPLVAHHAVESLAVKRRLVAIARRLGAARLDLEAGHATFVKHRRRNADAAHLAAQLRPHFLAGGAAAVDSAALAAMLDEPLDETEAHAAVVAAWVKARNIRPRLPLGARTRCELRIKAGARAILPRLLTVVGEIVEIDPIQGRYTIAPLERQPVDARGQRITVGKPAGWLTRRRDDLRQTIPFELAEALPG